MTAQRTRHRWSTSVVACALTAIAPPAATQVFQHAAPVVRLDPPVLSGTVASKTPVVETAALVFNGATEIGAPPSRLEYIDVPTEPRQSSYLSLPPFTGPWKACIGFRPDLRAPTGNPADYADCLDFVLAGPGSIGARPVVSFPDDEFKDTPIKGYRCTMTKSLAREICAAPAAGEGSVCTVTGALDLP